MIERHLTGEEKDRIWEAIRRERSEDDRDPVEDNLEGSSLFRA